MAREHSSASQDRPAGGFDKDTNLTLTVMEASDSADDFGAWLIAQAGTVPLDFELEF